mmetsp:Transcript_64050/g.73512  ORF Transcript_64050/g.73512 Transcript_64050/m.73512 type:complete len:300 (-) Transcript_64050:46-945(-)
MPVVQRLKALSDKLNSFEVKHPNWAKGLKMMGHLMSLATLGYAFYNIIEGFLNWKNLPWQQKLELITNFVQSLGEVVNTIFKIINVFRDPKATRPELTDAIKKYDDAIQSPETVESVGDFAKEQAPDIDPTLNEVDEPGLGRTGQIASEDATTVSRFDKLMNWTEKICRGLNVLALAAACVGLGFQIKDDFATGQPPVVKACDIIQMVGLVIQIGVELAGFFVESAALPVIGIVVALIGVVMMIISMIFHKKPPRPETPAEKFIDDTGKPYLNGLAAPSQDWLDKYHKDHPDTEDDFYA